MSAAGDALKKLRTICNTRNLRVEVERVANITVVTVEARTSEWSIIRTSVDAVEIIHTVHAAVMAKFPRKGGAGGPNHTKATIAAKRARLEAEQRNAMGAP